MKPTVTVNGTPRRLAGVTPHTTLLDWLRGCGLTGAKEGCAEGECGACSVMVARPAIAAGDATGRASTAANGAATEWVALNSCLVPAAGFDGGEVVTAEGLGSVSSLHPVQQGMASRGGSQCGYCTPGFVCSMAAEYYRPGRDGFDLHALSGNLCRCTGYRPIRDAAHALPDAPADDDHLAVRLTQPPPAVVRTRLDGDGTAYLRPDSLAEALDLLGEHHDAVLLAGATDLGVEVNLRGSRPPLLIGIDRLPELRAFEEDDDEIRIGAALTLTEVERLLGGRVPILADLFPLFASRLIRNGATLGGNLGTGSPIGDAAPALLALDARLVLTSSDSERQVPLSGYFTGYRESVRERDELIREVRIPLPLAGLTAFHKIAKRRFDDISAVAVGFALDVSDGVVRRARIGLGGVAATPVRANATEAALEGRAWDATTVEDAAVVLASEGSPIDDHRASSRYRAAMLGQSLRKFHAESAENPAGEGVPV